MIENQWYAILPSKEVRAGGLTAVRRLNLDLVLFRTQAGALGCVVDQCTHRGAALSAGKVTGDCVRCPFHGLQFDPAGVCRFIPANGKAGQADNSRYNVRAYPVREAHGIVYLWYGDPQRRTEPLPFFGDELDGFTYSEMADHWDAHYSRAIENQLDVVHVPIVHHNTIGRGNKTLINGPRVIFEDGVLLTSANNEVDNGQKPRKPEACVIKETYLAFRFPNVWMNHISDKVRVVIYFAPVDDGHTVLYIRFYHRIIGLRPVDALIAWVGKWMNRVIERQDRRVVITQKPKASAYRSAEKLLMGDGPIIEYRRRRDALQREE
ncbi:MAG: aromatic ring-hydroxylating dioxygenase subunit alpha [Clostridiales bacterium]|nr:aromatic ring-hydroxylating dioxygenase subunit alpha [Clostridiales bacterium]